MAVKGNLDSLGLEDLLRADLAARGEGLLTLRSAAHYASLHVARDGVYVLQPDLLTPRGVVRSFVARGLVPEEAVTEARQRGLAGAQLLEYLLAEGHLPQEEYLEVLAAAAEDTVLDLMLWDEGQFRFEEQPRRPSPGLQGSLCVDPVGILERATKRLDDRRACSEALGVYGILFCPLVGELPRLEGESDPLHEVYARLDGHCGVHEIALNMGVGRFEVLKAIARLVQAGVARAATADELIEEADRCMADRDHAFARALCLQWEECEPDEPGPLKKLASVASAAGRREMELDALCALGNLYIRAHRPREAVSVFKRAMRRAPADDVVLTGLRMAAEAAGDDMVYADSTLLTAQAALDEGKSESALELLDPLVESNAGNMAAHLLRARALVMGERRAELLEEAEIVGQVLSRAGCRTKTERETALFFRETIAEVAPERGDLLERFRSLHARRAARRPRLALVAVLLVLLAATGVIFWPTSASSLLEQAQEAVARGDTESAQAMIAELVERFPDSQEAEEAWLLQARLAPQQSSGPVHAPSTQADPVELAERLQALVDALPRLPAPAAQQVVGGVLEHLEETPASKARTRALQSTAAAFRATARALLGDALDRVAVLGDSAAAPDRLGGKPAELARYIEDSAAKRDPAYQERLAQTAVLLQRLAPLYSDDALRPLADEIVRACEALGQAARYYDEHIVKCKLTLAEARIEEADRRCREDAPKLMVAGRLAEADALYAGLADLLTELEGDETYDDLVDLARRRHIPEFLRDRRGQIADIHARLAKAREAEARDDIEEAVGLYGALVREYWLIRFENVFTLPVRIVTVPRGARITVNGEVAGVGPAVVRYAWGDRSVLQVTADGFVGSTVEMQTTEEHPPSEFYVRLRPKPFWTTKLSPRVNAPPLDVEGHVLVVDRSGLATLFDGESGEVRWTADHSSLEGVRCRPAKAGDWIYLARVEGQVLVIDPKSGEKRATLETGRPFGDLASESGRAAMATVSGDLLGLQGEAQAWRTPLGAVPTCGVVGAHGAFWVGTAQGTVVRVDAVSGLAGSVAVARASAPVIAVAATADGLLAATADRHVVSLTSDGTERWMRTGVGDLVGSPAETGGVVAVVDRQGHVLTYDAEDGTPRAPIDLGAQVRQGFAATDGVLVAVCADGRLWAYDPARQVVLADVDIGSRGQFAPTPVGPGRMAISADDCCLQLVPVPKLP